MYLEFGGIKTENFNHILKTRVHTTTHKKVRLFYTVCKFTI